MAGPGIRYYHFAKELVGQMDVTLMISNEPQFEIEGVTVTRAPGTPRALARAVDGFDVVVALGLPYAPMRRLARSRTRVVHDLYVPALFERLFLLSSEREPGDELFHEWTVLGQRFALATGDAFICASERQRDFWLGMLGALGRIGIDRYRDDPTLRGLIDVVPFGLPAERPSGDRRVLKGVMPGVAEDDRVLLWAGGVWNWLDPLTVIRAVARIARRRNDVKLLFLGLHHPQVPETARAREAVDLARSLRVLDRSVFFNRGWVPYDDRQAFLLEADLGISAHFDVLETRYAFRTRLLDYFWAGLPTITTWGDVLADLVDERGLGRTVAPGNLDGWVEAIEELLDDTAECARIRERLETVRAELAWPAVVQPLARLARGTNRFPRSTINATVLAVEEIWLRSRISVGLGGPRAAIERKLAKLGDPLRRLWPSRRP